MNVRLSAIPMPLWLPTWQEIVAAWQAEIRRYNQAHRSEVIGMRVKDEIHYLIEVFPKGVPPGRIWTVTLQVANEHTGELSLVSPPYGEGINRHGNFRIVNGRILLKPDFTGEPRPPASEMTPQEFARDCLVRSGFLPN
jgi:hypothetical protein